jgi:aspartyl/asparaginyl-tRNA synthetase
MALGRVYVFGPTFRAEKSKTRRHLTEFWMVEPEMAFADLDADMDLAEDFLVHVVQRVLGSSAPELAALGRDTAPLARVQKPFPASRTTTPSRRSRSRDSRSSGAPISAPRRRRRSRRRSTGR